MTPFQRARNAVTVLNKIAHHPLNRHRRAQALLGYARWQLGTRVLRQAIVFEWLPGVRAIVRRTDIGMNKNIYVGLHDFHDMAYLLHVTTPEDLFLDVGANVGSYTLLACGAKGARGFSFEPVPSTFSRLLDNIAINHLQSRVVPMNIGLSDSDGELYFTGDVDAINHVLPDGASRDHAIKVPVHSLDSVLQAETPTIMKIDVEGFETNVLNGASRILSNPALHSVIMELNGLGSRYGFDDKKIAGKMQEYGFHTYQYLPFTRTLQPLNGGINEYENTLFIRNESYVKDRIASSPRISISSVEL